MQQLTISLNEVEWKTSAGVQAHATVARLDQLHPIISGNKFFKLKYNIEKALLEGRGIITMGGAYSNHLAATAFACKEAGIPSIGIVRGEITDPLNHTLLFCTQQQMKLIAVARNEYSSASVTVQKILNEQYSFLFIPEGGSNKEGEKGCAEIASCIQNFESFTHIACAVGTGTTVRGLAQSLLPHQTMIAVPVVKIKQEVQHLFLQQHLTVPHQQQLVCLFGYAGKGYASQEQPLLQQMNSFFDQTGIPLDFVYTAKLIAAVNELSEQHYFRENDRLLILHTGGLQGNESLTKGSLHY
jgi:1-aminocyclopropane-1-carboxylate deaminase